jgi:hypothetical protein
MNAGGVRAELGLAVMSVPDLLGPGRATFGRECGQLDGRVWARPLFAYNASTLGAVPPAPEKGSLVATRNPWNLIRIMPA